MSAVTDPAITELEAKLKASHNAAPLTPLRPGADQVALPNVQSTLLALSHILTFHNSLAQLQATQYAPQAPKKLTRQLRTEAGAFDAVCDQLEHRVVSLAGRTHISMSDPTWTG